MWTALALATVIATAASPEFEIREARAKAVRERDPPFELRGRFEIQRDPNAPFVLVSARPKAGTDCGALPMEGRIFADGFE